jgi:hypothetical protein
VVAWFVDEADFDCCCRDVGGMKKEVQYCCAAGSCYIRAAASIFAVTLCVIVQIDRAGGYSVLG